MELIEFWDNCNNDFKEIVEDFTAIKENPIIRKIPLFECFYYEEYMEEAFKTLSNLSGEERNKWLYAMLPSRIGYKDPEVFWDDVVHFNDGNISSKTNIKCNHHYQTYLNFGKKHINQYDRIVEFGAGCGDMAQFILNMGFEGEYVIVDIPSSIKIQKHLLSNYTNITYTSDIVHFKPNTLLISTWGLSEAPLDWRSKFMVNLMPEGWLITYQKEFFDIDNSLYFDNWRGQRISIPWIYWDGGSDYIIF